MPPPPAAPPALTTNPNIHLRIPHPNAPPKGTYFVRGVVQESDGAIRHLRGHAEIESSTLIVKADSIDWNEDTGDVDMRDHVSYENYITGEKVQCDRAQYNIETQKGNFYNVTGTSPANVQARPGLLTTSNPFYFQGKWAERDEDHYILHEGFITDCKLPSPWWVLRGPKFDIVPGDRAITYHATFVLHKFPLLWVPAFYKSLKKEPRRSGFLAPNIGHSSLRGGMFGVGYYWAINRSYDLTYRLQYFTAQTFAHTVDFRGKVNARTDFNFSLYGVDDHSCLGNNGQNGNCKNRVNASGYQYSFGAKSDLGRGWEARADINYLSSFQFRQEFSQTYTEAIYSESHSIGYLAKHWDQFGFYALADRGENFLSTAPGDTILIRKLPEIDFLGREKEVDNPVLPFWWSFNSSFGLLDRTQPDFQTRQFVPREDFAPRVTTAFHWAGISLMPSFGIEETGYGSKFMNGSVVGANLLRGARLVDVDLVLPSLERTFTAPKWLAEKVRHVIEPRVTYRYASGIGNTLNDLVRFDQTELLSNTNELNISVTNRFYTKRKDGKVTDLLDWTVSQSRYFDPTFGGAVVPGQRNVLLSSAYLTGFAFIDGARNYSPIVSEFRFNYKVNLDWRADYDPLRGHIVNSTLSADTRFSNYFVSFGSSQIRSDPALSPASNQIRGTVGIGNDNRKGWNAGMSVYYDVRKAVLQFTTVQAVYNTDCCGVSLQFRRFNFGNRDENQFLFSFSIANVGTFGSLRRQDRTF